MLLPLQGAIPHHLYSQGVALGYWLTAPSGRCSMFTFRSSERKVNLA